ncbi:MAG TPA: hypothetical protein VM305_07480 [Candidatus Limnocylindrales bacterium]|nr:hypothetical protein [Candidatus Limnocylindrales bacterium]
MEDRDLYLGYWRELRLDLCKRHRRELRLGLNLRHRRGVQLGRWLNVHNRICGGQGQRALHGGPRAGVNGHRRRAVDAQAGPVIEAAGADVSAAAQAQGQVVGGRLGWATGQRADAPNQPPERGGGLLGDRPRPATLAERVARESGQYGSSWIASVAIVRAG